MTVFADVQYCVHADIVGYSPKYADVILGWSRLDMGQQIFDQMVSIMSDRFSCSITIHNGSKIFLGRHYFNFYTPLISPDIL